MFVLSRRFEDDFKVLTSNSTVEAIDLLEKNKGDIHALITDVKMPDMTGLQMIAKAKENLNGVPCFLLTGYDQHEEIEKALASKTVIKIFKKPFDYNEISNTLKEHLY